MKLQKILFAGIILLLSWTTLSAFADSASADTAQPEIQQKIHFLRWSGQVFSWNRKGAACWIHDQKGNLRFEVLADADGPSDLLLEKILQWEGFEGWTVISIAQEAGTFSRWNESWNDLPSSIHTWLRVVAYLAMDEQDTPVELPREIKDISPGGRPLCRPVFPQWKKRSRIRRLQLPKPNFEDHFPGTPNLGLRHQLTHRGMGNAGEQTVLNISGQVSGPEGMKLSSTHNPGILHLDHYLEIPVTYDFAEAFLPWWPLGNIISLSP